MFCSHTVSAQEDDIILVRTEPDPTSQELPCANQIIVYECRLLIPAFVLTWILPNGEELEFNGGNEQNNTLTDGTTIATLTEIMSVEGGRFLFTSTLLIQETIDMSSLTCFGATGDLDNPQLTAEATIRHSG